MERRNIILWVDLLAGAGEIEVPAQFGDRFDVRIVRNTEHLREMASQLKPVCIIYDCDYVDRNRLELIAGTRQSHSSIPFAIFSLEHSESLAVWSFRSGAIDFIAKPGREDEIHNLVKRLEAIAGFRDSRGAREAYKHAISIPKHVTNTQRSSTSKLTPAIYFVQNHYSERIYADAVARMCDLSPAHFSKVFRQRFKMSFQDFLLRYRVAKACCLIASHDAAISDVCYAVGFRDPSYFTRMFKRYIGVSPSEYRGSALQGKKMMEALGGIDEPDTSSSQVVRSLASELA